MLMNLLERKWSFAVKINILLDPQRSKKTKIQINFTITVEEKLKN